MSTTEDTLSPAEGEKCRFQINILYDCCPKDKNHVTNIFNLTKILRLKAQINVFNLKKLRTCVQRKYFHNEETAVKQFGEYLFVETFR